MGQGFIITVADTQNILAWQPTHLYKLGDDVVFGNIRYESQSEHTSGADFPTDLTAGKWVAGGQVLAKGNAAELDAGTDTDKYYPASAIEASKYVKNELSSVEENQIAVFDSTGKLIKNSDIKTLSGFDAMIRKVFPTVSTGFNNDEFGVVVLGGIPHLVTKFGGTTFLVPMTVKGGSIYVVNGGRSNNNTSNIYVEQHGVFMNVVPDKLPFDATLIHLIALTDGAETWTAEVHRNGSLEAGAVVSPSGASSATADLSIDFDKGDEISHFVNGSNISKPKIISIYEKR